MGLDKIGIIDLGSNTARLVIVKLLGEGHFMVIDQIKERVRLGKDMERDGFLKSTQINDTIKTIKMFRRLCDSYGIDTSNIIAVGTAAVRRAKNQKSFLEEVLTTCGIRIRVLSDEEEATLVYRGVINTTDLPRGLIFEIGGGSMKIIHYNRRSLLNYAVLPFGAITLTEKFSTEGATFEEITQKIEKFITEELKKIEWLKDLPEDTQVIGVGGSMRSLCKISHMLYKSSVDTIHNSFISKEQFDVIYQKLRTLDPSKKKRIKGVPSSRADILPSAQAAVNSLLKFLNADGFTVSACGLREGIMFNYALPATQEKPISDVLGYSLKTIVKYYNCNEKHCEHVVNLSVQLFKQLRVLHKFPRQYVKILRVASYLLDTGSKIKYYDYQKHSAYVILNSNIYGISHRDVVLASFVTAVYKNDEINMSEIMKYKDILGEGDIEIIRKLGIILRIAESLDRSGAGVVKEIVCDVLGDSVILKTVSEGDSTLEVRDALNSSEDFQRIFNKKLDIIINY